MTFPAGSGEEISRRIRIRDQGPPRKQEIEKINETNIKMFRNFLARFLARFLAKVLTRVFGQCPGNSRKIPGNVQEMTDKFPGNFRELSGKFLGNFEMSRNFFGNCPGKHRKNLGNPEKSYFFLGFPTISYLNGGPFFGPTRGAPDDRPCGPTLSQEGRS